MMRTSRIRKCKNFMNWVKEKPVEMIYKNIPCWVAKRINEDGNCFINRDQYRNMKADLNEYFGDGINIMKCEEGGYVIWRR